MEKKIRFEYQKIGSYTVVALNSRLSELGFQPVTENGKLVIRRPERTVKDCRNIDGCVYFHLGRVPDSEMVRLIELFQKVKKENGWKEQDGLIVPDDKFIFD